MRILSCNIRFSSMGGDAGERHWSQRGSFCIACIQARHPDIICLQECHNDQLRDFRAALGEAFECFYTNSYPGDFFPENAIFYRREALRFHGGGGWHLSEQPHVAGTKGWGSECVRLVNWLLLEDRRGRLLRILNTHFDHASQLACDHAAAMVNEDVRAWPAEIPQVLTGDLNCDPCNSAVKALEAAGWRDSMPARDRMAPTFHDFQGEQWRGPLPDGQCGRMDYIFLRGPVRAPGANILKDHRGPLYPSDHFFLEADATLE